MYKCIHVDIDTLFITKNNNRHKDMAKQINNPLNIDMASLMREQTGQTHNSNETSAPSKTRGRKPKKEGPTYRHCSFICDEELWNKMQAIARKENFTIRQVLEHWIKAGIDSYEEKNGKVKTKATRTVEDVL